MSRTTLLHPEKRAKLERSGLELCPRWVDGRTSKTSALPPVHRWEASLLRVIVEEQFSAILFPDVFCSKHVNKIYQSCFELQATLLAIFQISDREKGEGEGASRFESIIFKLPWRGYRTAWTDPGSWSAVGLHRPLSRLCFEAMFLPPRSLTSLGLSSSPSYQLQ